jgi:hypothetical protein
MEYVDYLNRLKGTYPDIAQEIEGFQTLESVLPWLVRKQISLAAIDVVFQDEYSHDFLVPLDDQRWLAFGIT